MYIFWNILKNQHSDFAGVKILLTFYFPQRLEIHWPSRQCWVKSGPWYKFDTHIIDFQFYI